MSGAAAIVFAHADAFPGPTGRRLFDAWRAAGRTVLDGTHPSPSRNPTALIGAFAGE